MRENGLLKQLGLLGADTGFYSPENKDLNSKYYVWYMLNRLQSMGKWGLDGTKIYKKNLNLSLLTNGYACQIEHEGAIKCLLGKLEGELDEDFEYRYFHVVNPYAKIDKVYEIGKDCTIIYNDSLHLGVLPILEKYGYLITESELSLYLAIILTRAQAVLSGADDKTLKALNKFLEDLKKGELGAIGEAAFLDSLKVSPLGEFKNFTYILEGLRYLYAEGFNQIGINANKDQKRESLASAEVGANSSALLPLIDDFTNCRVEGCEKANEFWRAKGYDINLTYELDSSWEVIKKESEEAEIVTEQGERVIEGEKKEEADNGSEQNAEE